MNYKNRKKMFSVVILIQVVIVIILLVFLGIFGYEIITNPSLIGEFIGNILNGIKSTRSK